MNGDVHHFDRRAEDVNAKSIATRMDSLEATVHEKALPELQANTRLCADLHAAIFGKDQDDGLQMRVQEMHDVFTAARNAIRVFTAVGNGAVKAVELGGKVAKPLLWIALLFGSIITFVKTGVWQWPQ